MSSEWIRLLKGKGLPQPRIEPWFEEEVQNPGDKKGPEEREQELDDLLSGEEVGRSSALCQETIPFLYLRR
jgi:hypothetical protein